MKRIVLGLIEKVHIQGEELAARIDTGAEYNSIESGLAKKLNLGPPFKNIVIRSSNGRERRPVVEAVLEIKGKRFNTAFNIANRSHMRYKVLIGQNILKKGCFLIDPTR